MTRILVTAGIAIFLSLNASFAQNEEILKSINQDIHEKFEKAFATGNFELFQSLHSKAMIRASGDRSQVMSVNNYLKQQEEGFKRDNDNNDNPKIELRLFERLYIQELASERGIYKFTVHPGMENEQSFYGQFHLLLRKEEGIWKILMDYDSNEKGTICEEEFLKAYDYENLQPFLPNKD